MRASKRRNETPAWSRATTGNLTRYRSGINKFLVWWAWKHKKGIQLAIHSGNSEKGIREFTAGLLKKAFTDIKFGELIIQDRDLMEILASNKGLLETFSNDSELITLLKIQLKTQVPNEHIAKQISSKILTHYQSYR